MLTVARIFVAILGGFWGIACLRIGLDFKGQSKTEAAWSLIYGVILITTSAAMIAILAGY
jgi:hypothetical protein